MHCSFAPLSMLALACLFGTASCDKPGVSAQTSPSASAASAATTATTTSSAAAAASTPSRTTDSDAGAPFEIVFQIHDGAVDAKTEFRAKLRVKTSDGQVFEYKTPVSHPECYLLAGESSAPSAPTVDGDKARLMCAGGAQVDEASVSRKSDTLAEIAVFQQAVGGPDTPPTKPINTQTFLVKVPKGAKLRTTFEAESPRK